MSHWIALPIVLPAMLAAFIVLVARFHLTIQRVFNLAGTTALVALAAGLLCDPLK